MAEESQKPASEVIAPAAEHVSTVSDAPAAEHVSTVSDAPAVEKAPASAPEPETEATQKVASADEVVEAEKPKATEEVAEAGTEKPKSSEEGKTITQSNSFKEESYVVSELPESQKKALDELKRLVQDALNKHEFTAPPAPPKEEEKKVEEKKEEEKTEEKKEEEKTQKKKEEEKAEEKKDEEIKTEKVEETPVPAPVEEPKAEEKPVEAPKAETEVPAPVEAVVVTEVVEKVTTVDEDGAKTVEAIEESVVSVSAPSEKPTSTEAESAATTEEAKKEEVQVPALPPPPPEEVFIWGIPLLGDEKSDVILLKFLRARDFKVKDAFAMLKNTVRWRKDFGIDALLEEDLGNDWDKVVFTHGVDKEGHPVCYNVFGEFQKKELYQNSFGDEEKRSKFLKWRIQFLEKSIRKFDFNPTGISTIVQVNDIKNSPGLLSREHNQVTNQALQLLQDNYPEFVAKQVFINVPWWYLAFNRMISPFLTQRTKSKFVFAGPSKSADTLFKYIAPEQVPIQYGGLSREGDQEFTIADPVTELVIKASTKHTVEIPVSENGLLVWEARVVGWDVSYGAEFVPSVEGGYTVIVQKARKISPTEEPVISNSFKIGEPGKIVLTIDNQTSKKKKLLYRSKAKPSSE